MTFAVNFGINRIARYNTSSVYLFPYEFLVAVVRDLFTQMDRTQFRTMSYKLLPYLGNRLKLDSILLIYYVVVVMFYW